MSENNYYVITSGDWDGVGTEVSAKALNKIGPKRSCVFIFVRTAKCPKKHLKLIDQKFNRITVNSFTEALKLKNISSNNIIDVQENSNPAFWVEEAAILAMKNKIQAIITAPLSKTTIIDSGLKDIGHTDILQRISKKKNLFMSFVGKHFSVVLASGHCPLNQVNQNLTLTKFYQACLQANIIREKLLKSKKPLAVVGLNPHAGEQGLLGLEELNLYKKLFAKLDKDKIVFNGPHVPDAIYNEKGFKQHSVFVAPYHDQGLIPFKLLHGQDSAVHITMGLPFIRTSVTHGTAKNIFNENKANPNSMIDAILWALKLAKN